jgi:hypothetical protein
MISGVVVLAGGYAIRHGRWELAVHDGDLGTDPVIEDLRLPHRSGHRRHDGY